MAHTDAEHKIWAFVLRHPPAEWAVKPLSYVRIAAHIVKKPDGSRPETSTVSLELVFVLYAPANDRTLSFKRTHRPVISPYSLSLDTAFVLYARVHERKLLCQNGKF